MLRVISATASSQSPRSDAAPRGQPEFAGQSPHSGRKRSLGSGKIRTSENLGARCMRRSEARIEFVAWRVTLFTRPQSDFRVGASLPQGAASLESVLCADELCQRWCRSCILSVALVAPLSVSAWSQTQLATLPRAITEPSGASPIPPFVRNQFGAGIGGGLRRDRTFFVGVGAYNVVNHPHFDIPSNTQSPFALRGNEDAVFKDAAGHSADNACQILTNVGAGRQIQLTGRFTF